MENTYTRILRSFDKWSDKCVECECYLINLIGEINLEKQFAFYSDVTLNRSVIIIFFFLRWK